MSDAGQSQLEPSDSDLLLSAKAEIDQLRRANEILAAKVETMDLFKAVLFAHPLGHGIQSTGLDVAYTLERRATALRVQGRMGGAVGDDPAMSAAAVAHPPFVPYPTTRPV